jgi:hypothetical protein
MSDARESAPSPFLLETDFWRSKLAGMDLASCGLLIIPREDLSSGQIAVDELRVRTHDGIRLFGLRGLSTFHPQPTGAVLRLVGAFERPEIRPETVADGFAEFVFQVPAGRRLEDRVFDVLRLRQLVSSTHGLTERAVRLFWNEGDREPDEFMIASRLIHALKD